MFRRPGESAFQAFVRNNRQTQQRNMGGKYWQDHRKQQYTPGQTPFTPRQRQQLTPSATIGAVRAEFDVERQGITGMDIHLKFSVLGARNHTFVAAAHFYFAAGMPLRDFNGEYCAPNGTVFVGRTWQPGGISLGPQHIVLFMPYSELHMRSGNHNLGFVASIWDDGGRRLAQSDLFPFTLQVS